MNGSISGISVSESKDRKGCTTIIAKVTVLNLGIIVSICFFHDSELSRVTPTNFTLSTIVNFLSLYIISKLLLQKLFFVAKCIKWVFSQFKDIRLAFYQFRYAEGFHKHHSWNLLDVGLKWPDSYHQQTGQFYCFC